MKDMDMLLKPHILNFVDMNRQPNPPSADSTSVTHFFLPKFRTIQTPKQFSRPSLAITIW